MKPCCAGTAPARVRLVKGSHIVVRRLFEHDHGYIFQTGDGRVVFALPFADEFTLIGTTDRNFVGDPTGVAPDAEEIGYLCAAANGYFRAQIGRPDVVWSFAGVRSLYDDGSRKAQDTTRDYVLDLDERGGRRRCSTSMAARSPPIGVSPSRRSSGSPMCCRWAPPGPPPRICRAANSPPTGLAALIATTRRSRPFLSQEHALRLVRAYGTRVERMLGPARRMEELGPCFGADLTAAEVRYLMDREWAQTADDVLWRRTKLGLRFSPAQREQLARFMSDRTGNPTD